MPETSSVSPEAILQDTITVTDGSDTYTFKIPTLHDEIRIGARIKALTRELDPNWDGFAAGMDFSSTISLRICATFEVLLKSSTARWPWSQADDGTPKVDSGKFPIDKTNTATRVYQGFNDALTSFREGGPAN